MPQSKEIKTPAFRWSYIALPTAVLAMSLILTAFFYPRLPVELAYHFEDDGTPDRFLGRNQLILVILLPQFLLTALGAATVGVMLWLSSRLPPNITDTEPERTVPVSSPASPHHTGRRGVPHLVQAPGKTEGIISLMGNIVVLPGIVLALYMLDVFLYNTLKIHFLTIWEQGIIVMAAGAIFLGIFFIKAFRGIRRTTH